MENSNAFVLLAGGKSKRMGVDKGLLKYQQTFWILEQLHRISKTSITQVYIGLGYHYQHYFNAIPWLKTALKNSTHFQGLKINTVINKTPELGSFSTLQTVLKTVPNHLNILLNHIDIPILNSNELQKIMGVKNTIVIPNFEGENGHPIKMETHFWKPLIHLNPRDEKARLDVQIKKLNPSEISKISVKDNLVTKNLNTKKDWVSFLKDQA